MVRIAPINLYCNPKTLWFDAGDLDLCAGSGAVVSTARGTEFGRVANNVFEADEAQIKKLKTPLKPVVRIATPEDEAKATEMERLSLEALPIFKEMVGEAGGDMHPVSVEYLFDGDKAIFYFEAEERVDFRELVRKLAAYFHVRIDMRQIGVRDEARMVGGLGHCGQELCCKRLGGEFCPVSIRMAKEQDLSLNPQKISGVCGRLMCCLRYEFDAYKDFKSRSPKQNAQVETPAGTAKVVDLDVPREIVSLKVPGEKPVKVPLAQFDPPEGESLRPNRVGAEAWEEATAQESFAGMGESVMFATTQLTGQDKLADPAAVRRPARGSQKQARNGSDGGAATPGATNARRDPKEPDAPATSNRKPRRRRSTKVGGAEGASVSETQSTTSDQSREQGGRAQQKGMQPSKKKQRSASDAQKKQGQSQGQSQVKSGQGAKQGPRPGQKASGLRQGRPQQTPDMPSRPPRSRDAAREVDDGGGHRRSRRRSHKAGGPNEQGDTASTNSAEN